jgi:hypothetical protein
MLPLLLLALGAPYPADSGIIDVTRPPYSAKGDGKADDTAALQKALMDHMGGGLLYLPAGTYLVSDTLKWSNRDSKGRACWGNVTILGDGPDKTILRLKDGSFTDAKKPRAVMWCGGFGSADWFHNYVKDLSIDTGKDNPGAVALQFYSNNSGGALNVRLRSGDGQGVAGLDLAHRGMNGPLLVKNLHVQGFRVGVLAGHGVNSQVLEGIRLEGQSEAGLANHGQALSVRNLTYKGPGIGVRQVIGHLVLLDSRLEGKGPSAIEAKGVLFARGVKTSGFDAAVKGREGQEVEEHVNVPGLTLFDTPARTLGLPVEEAPEVPAGDPAKWANVRKFHKGGDDWTPAIQAAIDSGAETVYFPAGGYKIGKTVAVRGKVRRLVGMNGWFAEPAFKVSDSEPRFRVEGDGEPVLFENFRGGFGGRVFVDHVGKRTLILRHCSGTPLRLRGGKAFLEDVCTSPHGGTVIVEGGARVWARQLNVELFVKKDLPATIDVTASQLWVLGLKTEQGNRLLAARKGAKVEVLGGLVYTVTPHEGRPGFLVEDASMSLSLMEQCYIGKPMDPVARQTQKGVTRELGKGKPLGLFVARE